MRLFSCSSLFHSISVSVGVTVAVVKQHDPNQPTVNTASLRHSSREILSCIKLLVKANHHRHQGHSGEVEAAMAFVGDGYDKQTPDPGQVKVNSPDRL